MTCIKWRARVREFNAESDHCHILIDYPPDVALTKLIANLKTGSSRYLRQEFPQIKAAEHKPVLWTASYFVASCGGVSLSSFKLHGEGSRGAEVQRRRGAGLMLSEQIVNYAN